ncbi:MAG: hypothetical protein JXA73_24030 [Acidobacteria bacterium]|nr:hypothetical protein [Acidobacteriota bacterium]
MSIAWIICGFLPLMARDYEIKAIKIQPIESYPARTTVGTVTIAVDPFYTNAKSYTAFDVKQLNSRGYFPVHVIIQNTSQDFLIIRTRNILLITSSGEQLYTTPVAVLLDDIFKSDAVDRLSQSASSKSSRKKNIGTPLSDFTSKDLTNKLVNPRETAGGFLFFTNPDPKKNLFAGSTLFIPKIEEEGTHKSLGPFSIPLDPAISPSK